MTAATSSKTVLSYFFLLKPLPPTSTLFPYTTLFRSVYTSSAPTSMRHRMTALRADKPAEKPKFHWDDPLLRSEEHTSELQSLRHLVCRLLLEKKKGSSHRKNTLEHGYFGTLHHIEFR